jgi:hypothetical protein
MANADQSLSEEFMVRLQTIEAATKHLEDKIARDWQRKENRLQQDDISRLRAQVAEKEDQD